MHTETLAGVRGDEQLDRFQIAAFWAIESFFHWLGLCNSAPSDDRGVITARHGHDNG